MQLKKILQKLPVQWIAGPKNATITGLSEHSSSVAPGNLFIAKPCAASFEYIQEAVASGACAVLCTETSPFLPEHVIQLSCQDLSVVTVALAQRFYHTPSQDLLLCGITGTNGKTTTGMLVKHLLECLGKKTGFIGTIAYMIGEKYLPANLTTPDLLTNYKLLHEMVRCGCQAAVMEVTSHALMQGRVEGLEFDAAIFTNLTQDHLDYHKTMEAYAEAKRRLFLNLQSESYAIVNEESATSALMLQGCAAKPLSYGLSPDADVRAYQIRLTPEGTHFQLSYLGQSLPCFVPLVGRHNIFNTLAAISFCLTQSYPLEEIIKACTSFTGVPGRLEPVKNRLGLNIYVDFAHTADALEQVCSTLRDASLGKLFVVFGAGGDRDKGKRPKMGAVVDRYAQFACITSDNPRSEDPFVICEQIAAGFSSAHYLIETDRRMAIMQALKMAKEGDTVLVAGRGHESSQVFAHYTRPFNDHQVIEQVLEEVGCL